MVCIRKISFKFNMVLPAAKIRLQGKKNRFALVIIIHLNLFNHYFCIVYTQIFLWLGCISKKSDTFISSGLIVRLFTKAQNMRPEMEFRSEENHSLIPWVCFFWLGFNTKAHVVWGWRGERVWAIRTIKLIFATTCTKNARS